MTRLIVIFLILFWLLPGFAVAVEIAGLYQAQVPVKTQEREERITVYPGALAQVIVKVTGDRQAPAAAPLRSTIKGAHKLVQQFKYHALPEIQRPLLEEQGYTHMLWVEFDATALNKALTEASLPVWGRRRPSTLVVLAVEDRGARYVLGSDASEELESLLDEFAQARGLPIMLPLMDGEDRARLGFADVWGNFPETILDASRRYDADAVLVGRLYFSGAGPWRARWTLYHGNRPVNWAVDMRDQPAALRSGIEGAADQLSQLYAQVMTADVANMVTMTVADIADLGSYARALRYLQSLDGVADVQVSRVAGDEVVFSLAIRGSRRGLVQTIALGSTMVPAAGEADALAWAHGQRGSVVYRLLP